MGTSKKSVRLEVLSMASPRRELDFFLEIAAPVPKGDRAQFLVADILYTQKDYRGALGEFEALVSALPRGEKVPDALVKIGLCERDLGDGERAKRTWERVVGDYPSTAAARTGK